MKNPNVATSMIITSTNVAVIMRVLCLNCDNAIRMTITTSDSAAEVSGRRSKTSQKKLSTHQVRTNAARAAGSSSDQTNMPKATRWMAARSAKRPACRRWAAARRFFRSRMAGGMTRGYSRALVDIHRGGRLSSFCNKIVMAREKGWCLGSSEHSRPGSKLWSFPPGARDAERVTDARKRAFAVAHVPRGDKRRKSRAKRFWDLFPRRGLLDKAAVEGLGEVDLGALELVVEGEKHVGGRRHAGGGNDAGARIDRLVGLDRREVERLVAEKIVFRHRPGDLLRRRLVEPPQRLVEGVDQRLHGRRILVDEILPQVEHRRGVRAAENRPRPLLRSAVDDDLDVAVLFELGDHRIEVGES